MNQIVLFVLTLQFVVSLFPYTNPAQANSFAVNAELLGRFETEAPIAWRRSKEAHLNFIKNSIVKTDIVITVADEVQHRSLRSILGPNYGAVNGGVEPSANQETVAVYNKSYFALLQRRKGTIDWLLKDLGRIPEHGPEKTLSEALGDIDIRLFAAAEKSAASMHPYGENPLMDYTKEEAKDWSTLRDRKIISIDYVDFEGREMVKVVMNFSAKVIDWDNPNADGSWNLAEKKWQFEAIFDPASDWCLREVTGGVLTEGDIPKKFKKTFSYSEVQGVQICVKRFLSNNSKGPAAALKWGTETRYSLTVDKDLTPADFTLSAYGLPEPDWYRPPTPWWLYSSIAGMVLVVCGAFVFRFGKRFLR